MLLGQVMVGAWVSLTLMVKLQVLELPEASVTFHSTVLVPLLNEEPLAPPLTKLRVAPEQLSANVGLA
jgi:hypothetical protein